jgi:hypothetical protein
MMALEPVTKKKKKSKMKKEWERKGVGEGENKSFAALGIVLAKKPAGICFVLNFSVFKLFVNFFLY